MAVSTRATTRSDSTGLTKTLLACGILVGPFFYVVAIAQILTRPGFDIRRHAISTLSLGDLGWIQITNFAVTGLLALAFAIGIRRLLRGRRAGTWGPVLIGIYSLGLIVGAIFHPDPGLGFPPGAPTTMPTTMSGHATIHMIGFSVAFLAVIGACFVFARLFASQGRRGWVVYSIITGAITPILIILGSTITSLVGIIFAVAGLVAFGWVSAVAAGLRSDVSKA